MTGLAAAGQTRRPASSLKPSAVSVQLAVEVIERIIECAFMLGAERFVAERISGFSTFQCFVQEEDVEPLAEVPERLKFKLREARFH